MSYPSSGCPPVARVMAPGGRRSARRGATTTVALAILCLALPLRSAMAQTASANSDEALILQVVERLLAVANVPAKLKSAWPPKVVYRSDSRNDINAFARCVGTPDQPRFEVQITPEIMQHVIKRDRDILAFIIGHELGHILLDHTACSRERVDRPEVAAFAGNRAQELAADSLGMQLAIKAGYSFRRAVRGMLRMTDVTSGAHSTVQSLLHTHPTWLDRGEFVSALEGDRQMTTLWRSMSAFTNGNYFLMVEQYEAAARAFKQVTTEFPTAYEAWANLGFALLMRYADGLDADDLRRFDLGQLVMPGFYRRPESLEVQVRGINSDLWWEAVGALREAIRLKPDLTLALAHLGIAHLIHPSGTRDVGNATRFLKEAAARAATDPAITPLDRVAIEINAGVAELAAGGEATAIFTQALDVLVANTKGSRQQQGNSLAAALDYNRALMLENSGAANARREAVQMLERYLSTAAPASAWWQIGYERYVRLAKAIGVQPKPEAEFRRGRSAGIRAIAGVEVKPGTTLNLGDPVGDATKALGKTTSIPAVTGTNLVLLRYATRGIDILAGDRILAIVLRGANAPAVPLRSQGLGGQTATLKVGMTEAEFNSIAGEFYDLKRLTDGEVYYRYYRDLGIGARVVAGRVEEIIVAQIPDR